MKQTKTERRVISAMRLLDLSAREAMLEGPWADEAPDHFLLSFKSILEEARRGAPGRKPSELQVHDALQKLVARGTVEKATTVGLGGGFTTYIMRAES